MKRLAFLKEIGCMKFVKLTPVGEVEGRWRCICFKVLAYCALSTKAMKKRQGGRKVETRDRIDQANVSSSGRSMLLSHCASNVGTF